MHAVAKCCTCIILKLLSHLSYALISIAFKCSTIMKLVVGFLKLHIKFGNSLLLYLQNEVFLALFLGALGQARLSRFPPEYLNGPLKLHYRSNLVVSIFI